MGALRFRENFVDFASLTTSSLVGVIFIRRVVNLTLVVVLDSHVIIINMIFLVGSFFVGRGFSFSRGFLRFRCDSSDFSN